MGIMTMCYNEDHHKHHKVIIRANEIVRNSLEPMLKHEKLNDFCVFEEAEISKQKSVILNYSDCKAEFFLPVRVGAILDRITTFIKESEERYSSFLDLGCGVLDTNLGKFVLSDSACLDDTNNKDSKVVFLTEKEVEILQYLYKNQGRKILRDELLKFVWRYAENTDTHTLETHIYRLRQKIELDPALPEILKKDDSGYFLGKK